MPRSNQSSSLDVQIEVDRFTFAEPDQSTPAVKLNDVKNGKQTFVSLNETQQSEAKAIMRDLDAKARLFARDPEGVLHRISPSFGKELLDSGEAIEVVRELARETNLESTQSKSDESASVWFIGKYEENKSSSSSSKVVKASYSSSPVSSWDSLLWHEGESFQGIPGSPTLPASGEPVTVSRDWESHWKKSSEASRGFIFKQSHSHTETFHKKVKVAPNEKIGQ